MDDAVAAKLRYLATQISHLKEKSKEVESNKLDIRQAVWRKPDQLNTFFHVRMKKTQQQLDLSFISNKLCHYLYGGKL